MSNIDKPSQCQALGLVCQALGLVFYPLLGSIHDRTGLGCIRLTNEIDNLLPEHVELPHVHLSTCMGRGVTLRPLGTWLLLEVFSG